MTRKQSWIVYPDARHDTNVTSELTNAEAMYWIDRIMALVKYLAREFD